MEIYNITPEIRANIAPRVKSFIYGFKTRKASKAPIGSAIPDKKVYLKAFFILPVEKYIGIATEIPSGILCIAMAKAIESPKAKLSYPAIKVAIPSGKLCNPMASVETNPTLKRFWWW